MQKGKAPAKGHYTTKEEKAVWTRLEEVFGSLHHNFGLLKCVILATDWSVTTIKSCLLPLLCESVLGLLNSGSLGLLSIPLIGAAGLGLTVDEGTGETSHQLLSLFVAARGTYNLVSLDRVSGKMK